VYIPHKQTAARGGDCAGSRFFVAAHDLTDPTDKLTALNQYRLYGPVILTLLATGPYFLRGYSAVVDSNQARSTRKYDF